MKKILSIIMSFCMLLTLVAVPVNVFAAEDTVAYEDTTLGSYYKFTFGEDEMYNYVKDATVEYKGNNITPLYYQNATGASVGYKEVTDSVTGDKYDTLQLQSGSAIMFTPLTKDGQPFELKPGVDYTFKVNLFIPVAHCWTHAFVAVGYQDKAEHIWGKYVNVGSEETPSYISSNYPFFKHVSLTNQGGSGWAYAFKDGTYGKTSTFSTIEGSTGVCLHKEDERFGVTCSHASYTGHKPYLQKTGAITIPAERFTLGEDNVYTSVLDIYSDNKGTDSGKDATVNNFFTLYLGGGSASGAAKSNPIYGNYTYDDMYDEEGKNIPIYDTYQIESIETNETGKGVANIHVGDTVTKVTGEAGAAIDLSIPEAPEGKYFVAWYTDAEYTTPVTKAQTIVEGASLDFYARFEEYGSYVKNDYTSNTYPDTVIQQTAAGYYYAAHGYSYMGNTYVYGTSDSVLKTKDNIIRELEAKGYATTPESGTLVFFSDRTWGMPGGIVAYNEDGTLFMPEAGAQYKVTYRYRSLVNNGNDMAINITYGISDAFANKATTGDQTPHKSTLKYNTLADVVPEWTVKSEVITIPATTTGYVPAIGLYIGAAKKVAVYAEDGTTVTGYTHTVVELDYLEVEKVKNVTFTAADGSTTTGAYVNGEAITYPELTDGDWYEAMWSLSKDEYIEVPETMGDTDITVYEFRKKVKNIITCINGSTTSYVYAAAGEDIAYPALTASFNYDYVWSLSEDSYSSAPVKANGTDFTVYAYQNPVISFENYPSVVEANAKPIYNPAIPYDNELNSQVSDNYAYSGSKSMKLENIYLRYIEAEPADWATAYKTKYFEFNEETKKWQLIDDATAPAFVANVYAQERGYSSANELGLTPIRQFSTTAVTFSYKITFKYMATENNVADSSFQARILPRANLWWGVKAITGTFTIPAGATDGWQTAEIYVAADNVYAGSQANLTQILDLRWIGQYTGTTVANRSRYTNEVYIDDITIEENFVNTPTVIFHDGETVTEVTEGVTAGADYTHTLVGTNVPEGLSFKGWSTTADGRNIVDTVTMPAETVLCKVHLYAVYGADPTIVYHDNGVETVIKDGLEGGAEYVIDRVGAGVEGKYFAGWATTENGTSYVSKITVTEVGDGKNHLYAVYKDYLTDGTTYNFQRTTNPSLKGIAYLDTNGEYKTTIYEGGYGSAGKFYTADGLIIGKDASQGANKWDYSKNGTTGSLSQQVNSLNDIAAVKANAVTAEIGEEQLIETGWSRSDSYVIRDADGNAAIPKANTKYAAIITYKQLGEGTLTISITAGRKLSGVNSSLTYLNAESASTTYASVNLSSKAKSDEFRTQIFTFTTGDFSKDVPVFSIYSSASGYKAKRLADDGAGHTEMVITDSKGNQVIYYPFEIVDYNRVLIKEVTFVEIDSENVGVTFMRYDAEKDEFIPEFKEGAIGAPLDVDTHNYDPKWYNSDTRITGVEVVTTYPSANATYYNATYGQLNPVAGTYVTGDGKKNGGEKEWVFENTLYDGKYALHIGGAKVKIDEGDVESYMTGVTLAQGHTYKVSFKYKATAAHSKFGFTFRACQADNLLSAGTNPNKGFVSVAAGDATDVWVTKTAYFTADFSGTVTDETETGLDYNVNRETRRTLQMVFTQDAFEAGNDLYFADIEVIDLGAAVVEEGGASVLTEEVAIKENKQAMRFYFNYKTDDGSNIYIGDDKLTVVERGFYYRNGYVANGGTVDTMYTADVQQSKTDNFNTCWAYNEETKMMTFSTYITGFGLNDDERKLEVNAYIIVADAEGNLYTIYADSINRTVEGVKGAGGATDNDFFAGS